MLVINVVDGFYFSLLCCSSVELQPSLERQDVQLDVICYLLKYHLAVMIV